jgi:hypothetical protein
MLETKFCPHVHRSRHRSAPDCMGIGGVNLADSLLIICPTAVGRDLAPFGV